MPRSSQLRRAHFIIYSRHKYDSPRFDRLHYSVFNERNHFLETLNESRRSGRIAVGLLDETFYRGVGLPIEMFNRRIICQDEVDIVCPA